ncbi:MAG: hypothetical protein JXR03_20505 [Cyclobacteriaceae bacterium]
MKKITSCLISPKIYFAVIFLLYGSSLWAQQTPKEYGIKNPSRNISAKCGEYQSMYNRLPIELRYGARVVDGVIYFYFPSERYLARLFDKGSDGIAIDIVSRDQYKCYAKNRHAKSWANMGYLMPPMYKKEMLQNMMISDQGFVIIKYGELPAKFDANNVECNLLVVQKKYLCAYHSFSHIDYSNWGLLEMGLYRDSLSQDLFATLHKEITKTLRFTVPFEKGKTEFSAADIKPLYDSLELTDYNIKEMSIKAYTSVEGRTDRNIEIQNGRAESIISALQTYQRPEISSTVSASENWVEFLNDIIDSRYGYMARLSKEEIKLELDKPDLRMELEPMLSEHRKALIVLKLEKRFSDEENNPEVLRSFFNQSIKNEDINEALYLQQVILAKIKDEKIPRDFIGKLEVPEESRYGALLNNFAIFNYESNDAFLYENIVRFEELLQLLPNNVKVKYNLAALKIRAWTEGEIITDARDIKGAINELEKLGLEKSLLRRLRVNYHIIQTQYQQQSGNYKEKNKSLKEVYWLYSKLRLNDDDLLSLSKYLSIYSKFEWAEAILKDRVREVDANEDLIYYYLKLTISNRQKTKQLAYRTFMLNAIDKSNQRFCDLFLPTSQGGYTFQLLDDEFLRKTYCESCDYEN